MLLTESQAALGLNLIAPSDIAVRNVGLALIRDLPVQRNDISVFKPLLNNHNYTSRQSSHVVGLFSELGTIGYTDFKGLL